MSIPSAASTTMASPAGIAPAAEDLGPLAWVLGEIQTSLDSVGKSLRRFARETGAGQAEPEIGPLQVARQQLHQAVGALQMVGHAAPARVLGAIEFAVQGFVAEPQRCTEEAVRKIERAGFAVTDFLEALLAGKSASSVALFPQYRDVLELVGNERVHPADLWNAAWRWVEIRPAPTHAALAADAALRSRLDREVLQLVKSGDVQAAQRLQAMCLGLARGALLPRVASFWTLAGGFFEAVALGLAPADVYVKRAASRVLLQYATLARGDSTVSDRLGQDLLFFCAQAVPPAHEQAAALRAVRNAWGVAGEQGVDYTIEQFGRFDPLVLAQARKRIESAKEMWSALSAGDITRTRQVVDTFAQLGESLQKLHPPSQPMAQALNHAVDASVRSGQPPATELSMEVATAVLYLEAALEDLDLGDRQLTARTVQLAGRIERVREGGHSEPLEPWMEELYRRISDRQTMGTVVDELRSHLGELEKSLDQYFRRPTEKGLLRTVPSQLLQMRGVFSVLGLEQAAHTVQRMRDGVEQLMMADGTEPAAPIAQSAAAAGSFDSLGNNLGALGFLIDMLGYQPALAKRLFVFDEEAGELRPLMGRQSAEAVAAQEAATHSEGAAEAVLSVEEVDARIASKLAALATTPGRRSGVSPIEEFSRKADSWTTKISGPAAHEALPDTEVTELEEDDLQNIFLDEAREVLHNGEAALAALASRPDDSGELTVLRRAFHTLKGSSRMVGLSEFGEAAWSFEQVLNTWLADQRPATPALLAVTGEAMRDFAQWVEAVAAGAPHAWQAERFSRAAEALRADAPAEAPAARLSDADALRVAARHIASEPAVPEAAIPMPELPALPDFAWTPAPAPAAASEPEPEQPLPTLESEDDFGASDFLDFDTRPIPLPAHSSPLERLDLDFDFLAHAPVPVFAPLPVPVSAPILAPPTNTAAADDELTLAPLEAPSLPAAPEPVAPFEREPEPELLELESPESSEAATLPAQLAAEALPPAALLRQPAEEAQPEEEEEARAIAAEPSEEAAATPGADDQVKVIGPLRIGIALYNVYLNEADEWSRQLAIDVGEWALEPHERMADSTIALAHSLAGSSATVGFDGLSGMARLLEAALQHLQTQGRGTSEQGVVLVAAADEVRRLLHQFAVGFLREPAASTLQALREVAASTLPREASDSRPAEIQPHAPPAAMAFTAAPPAFADATNVTDIGTAVHAFADIALEDDELEDGIDLADAVDADLFPIFEEEAAELLPQLGTALRQWAHHPDDGAPRAAVLRTLHTLKGSARLAGAMRLGERAHRMESEIEAIGSQGGADRPSIDRLLGRLDALQASFDALRAADDAVQAELARRAAAAAAPSPAIKLVQAVAAQPAAPADEAQNDALADIAADEVAEPASVAAALPRPAPALLAPLRAASNQAVRVRTQLLDRLVAQAGEVIITRSRLEAQLGQLRGSLEDLTGNLERLRQQLRDIEVQAESQMQSRLAQAKDSQQGFDPLEFDRFTRVQELTRMMAESVNDVATVQRTLQKTVQATEDDLSVQARQTRELQRGLLRTRMVEFEGISERLYRVVRQASKDTGKQVRLDITGGSIEMDRGVLDRMTPAFEHLLRNCVAHGIEDAATRVQAGKDTSGLIAIALQHEGNDVSVSFRDDGGGLDHRRIEARARMLGLLANDAPLSPEEATELIFQPGFSTAAEVSELAGRGIGMDVVRAQVAALGGRIETHSSPGQGTTFKLVLPLTTAVTHVVMLRAGEASLGIPSNLVELVQRVGAADLQAAYLQGGHAFGGEQVPLYWAGALLQASGRSGQPPGKNNTVVIVRSAAQRVALHVDEVLGNQEVVVKNLGPQLARLPGLAGISVLASGAVALIYNPVALAAVHGEEARARQAEAQAAPATAEAHGAAAGGAAQPAGASAAAQIPLVLVVDDSITVRRVTQRLLQREGYRVALAADGLQALERLQQERPAVVLSDIEMPRMDGFDLARNIRADAALAQLPIIMITSRIAEKHRDYARALGVDHYLGKPYSEDELLRLVRGYTAGSPEEPSAALAG